MWAVEDIARMLIWTVFLTSIDIYRASKKSEVIWVPDDDFRALRKCDHGESLPNLVAILNKLDLVRIATKFGKDCTWATMIAFSQSSKIMIQNSNHFGFFFVVRKMSIFVGNTIDRAHKHSLPLAAQKNCKNLHYLRFFWRAPVIYGIRWVFM